MYNGAPIPFEECSSPELCEISEFMEQMEELLYLESDEMLRERCSQDPP